MSALPDVRSHLLLDILGSIRVKTGKMSDDSQGRMKGVEKLTQCGPEPGEGGRYPLQWLGERWEGGKSRGPSIKSSERSW